jgi:hypothetical protein
LFFVQAVRRTPGRSSNAMSSQKKAAKVLMISHVGR